MKSYLISEYKNGKRDTILTWHSLEKEYDYLRSYDHLDAVLKSYLFSHPDKDIRFELNPIITNDIEECVYYKAHLRNIEKRDNIRKFIDEKNRGYIEALEDPGFKDALKRIESEIETLAYDPNPVVPCSLASSEKGIVPEYGEAKNITANSEVKVVIMQDNVVADYVGYFP